MSVAASLMVVDPAGMFSLRSRMLESIADGRRTMPDNEKPDVHQKALSLNLDDTIFGSFAEIGAGQEVARWFLLVGAASGTVAKTISAYDKEVSDQIYGAGTRYVSKPRLQAMLESEWEQDGGGGVRGQLQVDHGLEDPETGADRPLSVVLVRLRDAEGGEDGVPRELLDDTAVRGDAVGDAFEEAVDPAPHDLRVGAGDERRGPDEVDEEHRCELAFHH